MCNYIKDDGEQCGRSAEPFCHDHEDTPFAKLWQRTQHLHDQVEQIRSEDESGRSRGFCASEMDTVCDECETLLRRTERLREHPNMGGRLVFEAVVECDCDEHVLGSTSVRTAELPSGWL